MNQVQSSQHQASHAATLLQQTTTNAGKARPHPPHGQPHPPGGPPPQADQLELSEAARSYGPPPPPPETELDPHVQEVRAAIADGSYLTDDKIDTVVDRLFDELFGINE